MARIVITGGSGFLGDRLARTLSGHDQIQINGQAHSLDALTLVDQGPPRPHADPRVTVVTGSLDRLLAEQPGLFQAADAVLHLASAVSAECEANLDLGLDANLLTGVQLGRVLSQAARPPVLVFASSLAIYGGTTADPLPACITDATRPNPQNSYGAQKWMLEILFADLSRRGLLVARTLRLMTVSVRPGRSNGAASGFLSSIIREPLSGENAIVPVPLDLEVALNSPQGAVDGLIHALGVPQSRWGSPLGVNLPGRCLSVGSMIEALFQIGGASMARHLIHQPDPSITAIVGGWPSRFESPRARRIGFRPEPPFDETVRRFLNERTLGR